MRNIQKTTIGALLNFSRGYDLPREQMEAGNIPVVGSNGIIGYHSIAKIKAPCLTVGRSGSVGFAHYIDKPCWPHNTSLFVDDFKGNNPKYLYYLLQMLNLNSLASGTGVPTLNRNHIHPIQVNVITDKSIQDIITEILSTIDDKIELNNKINSKLESTVRTLYDYWFVQFDFPDDSGRPYKSAGGEMIFNPTLGREIPAGWEVVNLANNPLTTIIKPGIGRFDEQKTYLPTAAIDGDKIIDITNKITFDNREGRANMQPSAFSVWFAKMKNTKKVLYFGDYSADRMAEIILSTGMLGLQCKPYALEYVWGFVNNDRFETVKNQLSHGATQEGVNNADLEHFPIIVPAQDVLEQYSALTGKIFKQKYINEQESVRLAEIRDFLLPMLMNGQITV
jgi:type I restriction enzyme S subunit